MSRAAATIGVIILAACGTTSGELNTAPVQPITGTLTIGTEPLLGMVLKAKTRITLTERGNSGYIDVSMKSRVDVSTERDKISSRTEILDTWYNSNNLRVDPKASQQLKSLIGLVMNLSLSQDGILEGIVEGGPIGSPKTFSSLGEQERGQFKILVKAFFDSFLGGKSVSQGQQVMTLRLKDLVGDEARLSMPDVSVSGRVIGQSVYQGRPVVVVKSVGDFTVKHDKMTFEGVHYADAFSGVPLHSSSTLSGVAGNVQVTVKSTQDADLSRVAETGRLRSSVVTSASEPPVAPTAVTTAASRDARPDVPWQVFQPSLRAATSRSPNTAQLPANIRIAPPAPDVPAALSAMSGKWVGWMCRDFACSTALAVEEITPLGARISYAFASGANPRQTVIQVNARWWDGELISDRFPDGGRVAYRLRGDGDLDVTFFRHSADWSCGVVTRE